MAKATHRAHLVPILAGGGTRLPAHVGILAALDELGVRFHHLVGVSGGSIVAALYAAGLPLERLRELALEEDFSRFRGYSLSQLLLAGGLSSGQDFEHWLDGLLEGRCFRDLELDLHVVATDVRSSRPVIFDRCHSPDLPVSRAVRCSMGIPLLFTFVEHDDQLLVDGSILSEDALHRDWAGDGTPVYCFRLRSSGYDDVPPLRRWRLLADYLGMLIRTFMITVSREFVNDRYWPRTVVVDTGEQSPLEFTLSRERKAALWDSGYWTVLEILPRKYAGLASPVDSGRSAAG